MAEQCLSKKSHYFWFECVDPATIIYRELFVKGPSNTVNPTAVSHTHTHIHTLIFMYVNCSTLKMHKTRMSVNL